MISIVTPTLHEAANLPRRAAELALQPGPWEWIVADGGSRDHTAAVAERCGARVVQAPRGRGPQLNAGAACARGQVLLFLHADTSLPRGALAAVRRALQVDPALVGGNFRLRFEGSAAVSALFTAYYRLQQRLLGAYYGDSTIFVRRSVFQAIGGFDDQPIMEDYEFVRRLEAHGPTTCLEPWVRTSARRYEGRALAAIRDWVLILGLYRLGVPAGALAERFYPAPGEEPGSRRSHEPGRAGPPG